MKNQIAIILALTISPMALAQDAFKCKTPAGMVYQDRPCKAEIVAKTTGAPPPANTDTQDRLDRDKKYLAERAYAREKTEAKERVQYCEQDAYDIQAQIERTAAAPLPAYVQNRVGIAQMQLDETRRQSVLTALQSRATTNRHACDEHRRALAQFK